MIKFLDLKSIDKNLLCFCVGSATEKKARSAGFQNVIAAEGNVENLKELIMQNFNQKDGNLIYISGETVSANLDQQLLKEGYNIKRIINYRTSHNQNFSDEFVKYEVELSKSKLLSFVTTVIECWKPPRAIRSQLALVSAYITILSLGFSPRTLKPLPTSETFSLTLR